MNRRQQINFVAFVSKPHLEGTSYESAWKWQTEEMIGPKFLEETFGKWEGEVRELISVRLSCFPIRWIDSRHLQLIPDKRGLPGVMRMPIFALKPLPKYVHGRVALLGDAVSGLTSRVAFDSIGAERDLNLGSCDYTSLGIRSMLDDRSAFSPKLSLDRTSYLIHYLKLTGRKRSGGITHSSKPDAILCTSINGIRSRSSSRRSTNHNGFETDWVFVRI